MNDFENLMSEIIEFVDTDCSSETLEEIKLTSKNQKKYISNHKYNLERFNLTQEKIKKDCASVYETFNI